MGKSRSRREVTRESVTGDGQGREENEGRGIGERLIEERM